jgi:hypothetical protein
MWRLAFIVAIVALSFGAGCAEAGSVGDLCSSNDDCLEGNICVSQVMNCSGEDCWGACERECVEATDCDGGDICIWIRTARVCRPSDYQSP